MNHALQVQGWQCTDTDEDIGDGSGNWNDRRTKAAEAVLSCILERFRWVRVRFMSSHFLYDLITLRTLILHMFISSYSQIMWYILKCHAWRRLQCVRKGNAYEYHDDP